MENPPFAVYPASTLPKGNSGGLSRIRRVNFAVLSIHDVPGRVENLQEFIH
jgi:hypothetical protein